MLSCDRVVTTFMHVINYLDHTVECLCVAVIGYIFVSVLHHCMDLPLYKTKKTVIPVYNL